jgi:tetratricopeptide (TPR) repeat protein
MGWFERKIEGKTARKWRELGYKATDLEEQIKCYTKAIELDPKSTMAWNNKGNALNNMGKYEDAIKCFDKAIELDPEDEYAWNRKGTALKNMRKYEDSIKCFDRILNLNILDDSAWKERSEVFEKLGKTKNNNAPKKGQWEYQIFRASLSPEKYGYPEDKKFYRYTGYCNSEGPDSELIYLIDRAVMALLQRVGTDRWEPIEPVNAKSLWDKRRVYWEDGPLDILDNVGRRLIPIRVEINCRRWV